MLMDLESKAFKIALKEIPKEYKMDEKKVFITRKVMPKQDKKKKKSIHKKKTKKKNISNKYKSK